MKNDEQETSHADARSRSNVRLGTTLTLTNENGEYIISLKQEEMRLDDIFENMVIPLLKAAGYSEESINGWLNA